MIRKRENIHWAVDLWGKCIVDARRHRRRAGLLQARRKAIWTQITTCYRQGMQKSIAECITHRTMRHMSFRSRRVHHMPLLSFKNWKLQITVDHQSCTAELANDFLVWWVSISLQHLSGRKIGTNGVKAWIHPILYPVLAKLLKKKVNSN